MLMQREHETVQSGGMGAGGNFTIAASAKAFEILSSNLYQNKILAVIRETVCNAADAHTVAKRPISHIRVHLPTYTEPYFAVRDFGAGLSRDDAMTLYTTYFQSTKDADNSQIGGFGLGSKSPFAVADQFTVTSWHGGTKNTYVCYKQDGLPRVNAVGSVPCGGETGIEVRVAVPIRDLSATVWQTEARSLFRWWPEKPIMNVNVLIDDDVSDPTSVLLKSDTLVDGLPAWAFYKAGTGTGLCVVMGRVPYTLNLYAIPGMPADLQKKFLHKHMMLALPIGAVDISPSRETLSYDAATCKTLVAALEKIVKELRDRCAETLSSAKTLAEARQFLYSVADGSPALWHNFRGMFTGTAAPLWQGKAVEEVGVLQLTGKPPIASMGVLVYQRRRHWRAFQSQTWAAAQYNHVYSPHPFRQQVMLWTEKLSSKTYRTLRHNYGDDSKPKRDVELMVLHGVPYAEAARRCAAAGILPPLDIEKDLEAPPKMAKGTTARAETTQFYEMKPHSTSFNYELSKATLLLHGGGLYVPFADGDIADRYPADAYAKLLHRGLLKTSTRVVGISRSKLSKNAKLVAALAANGWKEMTKEVVAESIDETELAKRLAFAMYRTWKTDNLQASGYTMVQAGLDEFTSTGKAWSGFERLAELVGPNKTLFATAVGPLMVMHGHFYPLMPTDGVESVLSPAQNKLVSEQMEVLTKLRAAWNIFVARHPLLRLVARDVTVPADVLRSYINR
jgi:hypothetical protein